MDAAEEEWQDDEDESDAAALAPSMLPLLTLRTGAAPDMVRKGGRD